MSVGVSTKQAHLALHGGCPHRAASGMTEKETHSTPAAEMFSQKSCERPLFRNSRVTPTHFCVQSALQIELLAHAPNLHPMLSPKHPDAPDARLK